jgi:hypothetical protein
LQDDEAAGWVTARLKERRGYSQASRRFHASFVVLGVRGERVYAFFSRRDPRNLSKDGWAFVNALSGASNGEAKSAASIG